MTLERQSVSWLSQGAWPVATLIGLLGAACSGENVRSDGLVVRDSAGIRIVEHPASAVSDPRPALEAEPTVVIGAGGAEQELFRVSGAARLSDGRLAILNTGSSELRFYARDGRLEAAIGRQGRGPGEFIFPLALLRGVADSLAVFDYGTRTFSFFSGSGELGRVVPAPGTVSGLAGLIDAQRAVLAAPTYDRTNETGLLEMPMLVSIMDLATARADTIARLGTRQAVQSFLGELRMHTPVPYTVHPVVRVHDATIYMTDGVSNEVHVLDPNAGIRRMIRFAADSIPADAAEYGRFVDEQVSAAADEQRTTLRRAYAQMRMPPQQPFFDELIVSTTGEIWVREFELLRAGDQSWQVSDSSGLSLERVSIPSHVRVLEVGPDYVIGLVTDELGVEHVHSYARRPIGTTR